MFRSSRPVFNTIVSKLKPTTPASDTVVTSSRVRLVVVETEKGKIEHQFNIHLPLHNVVDFLLL